MIGTQEVAAEALNRVRNHTGGAEFEILDSGISRCGVLHRPTNVVYKITHAEIGKDSQSAVEYATYLLLRSIVPTLGIRFPEMSLHMVGKEMVIASAYVDGVGSSKYDDLLLPVRRVVDFITDLFGDEDGWYQPDMHPQNCAPADSGEIVVIDLGGFLPTNVLRRDYPSW